jgi:hypothetical protein
VRWPTNAPATSNLDAKHRGRKRSKLATLLIKARIARGWTQPARR